LLAIGISQAQAFIDGNKRTAFATLDAFLWVNEWEYVGEPLALAQQLEHLAERSADPPGNRCVRGMVAAERATSHEQ